MYVKWSKNNSDDLGYVGPHSKHKAVNKCSAHIGSPSRLTILGAQPLLMLVHRCWAIYLFLNSSRSINWLSFCTDTVAYDCGRPKFCDGLASRLFRPHVEPDQAQPCVKRINWEDNVQVQGTISASLQIPIDSLSHKSIIYGQWIYTESFQSMSYLFFCFSTHN